MKCGIYGIRNIVDGKWYVGQSVKIEERRGRHFGRLAQGTHFNEHLQASYNCYGKECFDFHILEEVPEDMLDIRERTWIAYYESIDRRYGYNYENGGSYFKRHSEESKRKMSEASKGRIFSEETRRKLSLSLKGRKLSKETRVKMGKSRKGKHRSLEICKKISNSKKGVPMSEEQKCKLRKIHGGGKSWHCGKPLSKEHRLKLAESNKATWAKNHV